MPLLPLTESIGVVATFEPAFEPLGLKLALGLFGTRGGANARIPEEEQ